MGESFLSPTLCFQRSQTHLWRKGKPPMSIDGCLAVGPSTSRSAPHLLPANTSIHSLTRRILTLTHDPCPFSKEPQSHPRLVVRPAVWDLDLRVRSVATQFPSIQRRLMVIAPSPPRLATDAVRKTRASGTLTGATHSTKRLRARSGSGGGNGSWLWRGDRQKNVRFTPGGIPSPSQNLFHLQNSVHICPLRRRCLQSSAVLIRATTVTLSTRAEGATPAWRPSPAVPRGTLVTPLGDDCDAPPVLLRGDHKAQTPQTPPWRVSALVVCRLLMTAQI